MIAKTIFYVAAVFVELRDMHQPLPRTTEKEHVEQEVVYRPVEEVRPDVGAAKTALQSENSNQKQQGR